MIVLPQEHVTAPHRRKLYLLNCLVAAKRNIRGNEFRSLSVEVGFVEREKEQEKKREKEKERKR